uniref:Vegetative cell wall protein gp1-like n=1 Tax=Ananas comosus var. bracteatus TaxID=296719 RepID=A0A6V7PY88_ANACO|nr:unnamed protein product [Ananas comosus var. bracteatus]
MEQTCKTWNPELSKVHPNALFAFSSHSTFRSIPSRQQVDSKRSSTLEFREFTSLHLLYYFMVSSSGFDLDIMAGQGTCRAGFRWVLRRDNLVVLVGCREPELHHPVAEIQLRRPPPPAPTTPERRRSYPCSLRPPCVSPDRADSSSGFAGGHPSPAAAPPAVNSRDLPRASPSVAAHRRPPPEAPAAAQTRCGPRPSPCGLRVSPPPMAGSTTFPSASGDRSSPPGAPPTAALPPQTGATREQLWVGSPSLRHQLPPAAGQYPARTSRTCRSHSCRSANRPAAGDQP